MVAHEKLHESLAGCSFVLHDDMEHVLGIGQTVLVLPPTNQTAVGESVSHLCDLRESGPLPKLPDDNTDLVPFEPRDDAGLLPCEGGSVPTCDGVVDCINDSVRPCSTQIEPTAVWTQLPMSAGDIRHPTNLVVATGECFIDESKDMSQPYVSATPLLALCEKQFLSLSCPSVTCPKKLWSLRDQFILSHERLEIIQKQADMWADDELRFHMHLHCQSYVDNKLVLARKKSGLLLCWTH